MSSEGKNKNRLDEVLGFITSLETGRVSGKLAPSTDTVLGPIIEKLNKLSDTIKTKESNDAEFIVESLGIGIWKWDLVTNSLEWDKNMYKLYGADPQDFTGAYDAWESSLSPETKAKAVEEINTAVAGGKSFDTTFQVVHKKTGKIQEIRTRAFIIRDDKGKPLKMWGINIDRTREAELEGEIQKTLKTLKATAEFLELTGNMVKVGGWELDLETGQVFMSRQTQLLHEIDDNYKPPLYSTGSEWYPPEAWPKIKAAVDAAIANGTPYDLESPFITAKGNKIWVRVMGVPQLKNGKVTRLLGTFQDITAKKLAEIEKDKTAESLAIYKAVLDNSTDFIGIADLNMIPTYCNPAGRKLIGIPLEMNIQEAKIEECYPEDLRKTVLNEIFQSMNTKGIWSGETFFQHLETKERIPVHDVHFLVKEPTTGLPIGHATITRDISKEKLLQLQAIHQSKLASLGEMSAGIAHEINNPLAVISGNISLLKRHKSDEVKFSTMIEKMVKSVTRIEKIVKGLRKFSRTSGEGTYSLVSLEEIVTESLLLTEAKAKRHSTQITTQVGPDLFLKCDTVELEQVLVNLINNGIDAIKTHSERWIKISAFQQNSEIVLQVVDSGPGISVEVEKKMFQPFFTTKEVGEGTGLGLSIAKGILDSHSASITLNRSFPTTCFEMRFPSATPLLSESKNAA